MGEKTLIIEGHLRKKRNNPGYDPIKVRHQRSKKYKKYLKAAICSLFGLVGGFLVRYTPGVLLLLFLFAAYLLIPEE